MRGEGRGGQFVLWTSRFWTVDLLAILSQEAEELKWWECEGRVRNGGCASQTAPHLGQERSGGSFHWEDILLPKGWELCRSPGKDSSAESSSGQLARWSTFILVKTRLEQRHFSSTVQKQKQKAYDVELCQGRAGKKKKKSWPCVFQGRMQMMLCSFVYAAAGDRSVGFPAAHHCCRVIFMIVIIIL